MLLVGCNSVGGLTLSDNKGNKYTFKNESLNCGIRDSRREIDCEGSAIKKDILGNKNVVEFPKKLCVYRSGETTYTNYDYNFICRAAIDFGKVDEFKNLLR